MKSFTTSIDGYTVTLLYPRSGELNDIGGVIFEVDCDMDDPSFLQAMKKAVGIYPYGEAIVKTLRAPFPKSHSQILDQLAICEKALSGFEQCDFTEGIAEKLRQHYSLLKDALKGELKKQAPSRTPKPGYVYVLQSPTGAYKIGHSKNPHSRLKTFQVKLPFEVEYVCLVYSGDMQGLELELHERFDERRINGEWFALSEDDIAYIQSLSEVSS